jgi:Right handed beta helix region
MVATTTRFCLALAACSLLVRAAHADTLSVGEGRAHATPCAALAAAKPGDVIEVSAGTYTDSCAITVAGVTLRGVGGRPVIDVSGTDHPAEYKGIYVVRAADVTLENLELTGAHIAPDKGENAAAIRLEAPGLTVRGCTIHGNQNGLLGGTTGTLTIEHTELYDNGRGNGCAGSGCTHNLYVANIDELVFRFNWSHAIAGDTPDKGHLLKSRAKVNRIFYNRLSGEDGTESYELEFPNGGLAVVVGNVIQKGPRSGNPTLLSWGAEGASNPDKRLVLAYNTFVNGRTGGTFVHASGAELSARNNLFAGPGTPYDGAALPSDNVQTQEPAFADAAGYDFRPTSASPGVGAAVDPGSFDGASLRPEREYSHPAGDLARVTSRDVGAFEHDTPAGGQADAGSTGTGADGGAAEGGASPGSDAGNPTADGAAGADSEDGDGGSAPVTRRTSGGCALAPERGAPGLALLVLVLTAVLVQRRAARQPILPKMRSR